GFAVSATFDLTLPNDLGEVYAVRLTDRGTAVSNTDDALELRLVKINSGGLQVQLRDLDFGAGTTTTLQSFVLSGGLPSSDQIKLTLNHTAGSNNVVASYQIYDVNGTLVSNTPFT